MDTNTESNRMMSSLILHQYHLLLHCFQQPCLQEKSFLSFSQYTFGKAIKRSSGRNEAWLGLKEADNFSCLSAAMNATLATGSNTKKHH